MSPSPPVSPHVPASTATDRIRLPDPAGPDPDHLPADPGRPAPGPEGVAAGAFGPDRTEQTAREPGHPLPRRRRDSTAQTPEPADPARRRRARRNSHQTRALLLEAARRRFDRLGYDKASVRDIAADAGVSQGLIFRYFGSKEELYRACTAYEERLARDTVFSAPPDELAKHLMGIFRRIWPAMGNGCHPLVGLMRQPSADVPGHAHLRRRLVEDLPHQFGAGVAGEDAEERGLLLLSCLMGMGVMRSIIGAPGLQNRSLDRIAPYFERVVAALVADPAGTAPAAAPAATGGAAATGAAVTVPAREDGTVPAKRHSGPVTERRSA